MAPVTAHGISLGRFSCCRVVNVFRHQFYIVSVICDMSHPARLNYSAARHSSLTLSHWLSFTVFFPVFIFLVASAWTFIPSAHTKSPLNLSGIASQELEATAKKRFDEGAALYRQGTEESLRKALENFEGAAALYHTIGNKGGEGKAIHYLGQILASFGDNTKSLKYLNQSLQLRRAAHDSSGEIETLNGLGLVLLELKENEKSLGHFQQAFELAQTIHDWRAEVMALNGIGSAWDNQEEKKKALKFYERALAMSRMARDQQSKAETLNGIASIWDDLGEKKKALTFYKRAIAARRLAGDRRGEAKTLNGIGIVLQELGDKKKALDYYEKALPLRRLVGDRSGEARTLVNIANTVSDLGERQKALDHYEQAKAIYSDLGDETRKIRMLNNIGSINSELGEKRKALDYFEQSLAFFRKNRDRRNEATILDNIGTVWFELGEVRKATGYFEQALLLHRELKNPSGESKALYDLAAIWSALGEKNRALEYYQKALSLRRKSDDRRGTAYTLNNIGTVWFDLGEKGKALEYFRPSLPLFRRVIDRRGEATALNGIGEVLFSQGKRQAALVSYEKALPLFDNEHDRSGQAYTLNNIGTVWLAQKQAEKALRNYNIALQLYREVEDKLGEAYTLKNLGEALYYKGEKVEALANYENALPLFRVTGNRAGEAKTLSNLMFLLEVGNPRLAIFFGKQAVNHLQELRSNIQGLDKSVQRTFLKSVESTYRKLSELLIAQGRIPEAERVQEMLKEEEYFKYLRRDAAVASALNGRTDLTPEEAKAVAEYARLGDQLTAIGTEFTRLEEIRVKLSRGEIFTQKARWDEVKSQVESATRAFRIFQRQLAEKFGETNVRVNEVKSSLQSALKGWGLKGTVVITTIVGEDQLNLIVTTPSVQLAHIKKIKAAELNNLVVKYRAAITNACACLDPNEAGQQLYDLLVKPLKKDLEGAEAITLIWSLDGALRYLPMAALWDGDSKEYLAEQFNNVLITLASRTNIGVIPKPVSEWQVLGVGVSKSWGDFPALPAVPSELRGIIRQEIDLPPLEMNKKEWKLPGRILLDAEFTRDNWESELGHYSVIHIASHFSFRPGKEKSSYLLLGNGTTLTLDTMAVATQIFSGVELLTLSACDTANSSSDGSEVEGFAMLAQEKGARAVLATLWKVADESTALQMREFYRLCQSDRGLTKAAALQGAQLALMRGEGISASLVKRSSKGAGETSRGKNTPLFKPDAKHPVHPYYWAPFILIGNWR